MKRFRIVIFDQEGEQVSKGAWIDNEGFENRDANGDRNELESKLKTLNLDELSSKVIDSGTYMESVIFSGAKGSRQIFFELWKEEHVEVEATCKFYEDKTGELLYESEGDMGGVFMGLACALGVRRSDYHDDAFGDGSHQL